MPNPFIGVINSLFAEPHASLLNGILFGLEARMPKELFNSLVTTGTLHIIALSGMNISILVNLISRITLFLGRKASSIFSMCLIVVFVTFVGASPSIVRAAIMGCLSLIAVYFGRRNWGLLSLVLASLIMLLANFSLIKDLSFQLSFLATIGIILANKDGKRQKKKSLLDQAIFATQENFKLTLSAQIFTLPVILFNFRRVSLIAPLANILIEWAMQPIMILGFITAIMGFIWWPLGIIPAWISWVFLTYVIKLIRLLALIPGASKSFY